MKNNRLTFIHLSDVYMGISPDENMPWSDIRHNEIMDTFKKIISYAKTHDIDFVFISGDLYNHIPSEADLAALDEICSILDDACVIYLTGEQDYLKQDSPITFYDFKSNICVPGRDKLPGQMSSDSSFYVVRGEQASYMLDCLRFENQNLDVYGVSYFDKTNKIASLDGIRPFDESRINILLAHGGEERYLPINFQELKTSGFDYVALGHRFKYECVSGNICYSGSPEPFAMNQQGRHGFIEGEITESGLKKKFVNISKREYKTINYPVNNYMSDTDIIEDIKHLIDIEGANHIYTINIVRLDGCEKNFDLADSLENFNILSLSGEKFERTEYDSYIKANRNNEFAVLMDEMYAESPIKRDGAKMAVDTMIELSGINRKKGKRMSTRTYADTYKQAGKVLSAKLNSMTSLKEVLEYEEMKEKLEVSPDVLNMLNVTWAKERKAELEYRTIKTYVDELPRKNRRSKIRTAARTILIPLIIFGVMMIVTFPQGIAAAAAGNYSDRYALSLLLVAVGIVICLYVIYLVSKKIGTNDIGLKSGNKENRRLAEEKLEQCMEQVEALRAKRRELQALENQRKGLLEEISIRERNNEKIYYDMRVLQEAINILNKHDIKF